MDFNICYLQNIFQSIEQKKKKKEKKIKKND
jgi:hypothetical protein